MDELNYLDLPGLIQQCVMGHIDMHEPIEISNRLKNQRVEISILKHLLILCERDSKSLIHILSTIRFKIKEYLLTTMLDNHYIKGYIQNVILEWGYEISIEELLMDGLNNCGYIEGNDILPYEILLDEKNISEETSLKLKIIEDGIKERQESYTPVTREYAEDIQGRIRDLHGQCKSCMDRVKEYRGGALEKISLIEPKHRDILIDLAIKPKSMYIEYLSIVSKDESSILSGFMNDLQNVNIPDNIHTIFLNYVITINMLKKEINYISNSFKKIMVDSQPRLQLLDKFTDGSDDLQMVIIDKENDITKTDLTKTDLTRDSPYGFGFSFF